jgi:galactokinase
MEKEIILNAFYENFGQPEIAVFAPGRANIIGEHTDYNDGFVLPFAIDHGVWFYARKNQSDKLTIIAINTDERIEIDLHGHYDPVLGWDRFFNQVLQAMSGYPVKGADIVFGGDLPIGAGISSSSAITCGFVRVIDLLNDLQFDADEIVNTAITAERGSGVRGGIMDQYTIVNGMKDKAILLDCRTNSHEDIDIKLGNHCLYLFNTNVKHNLVNTDYNNRRAQCEEAVSLINQYYKKINALRDLNINDLPGIQGVLNEMLYKRASFVICENERVIAAVDALKTNNFEALGQLLFASHDGLSNDYEVSCRELDWLVEYALEKNDIFAGARMMGGGFGGCTINLTRGRLDENLRDDLMTTYYKKFGIKLQIIPISPQDGILHKKS